MRANLLEVATPRHIFRHLIEGPGELHFTPDGIQVALRPRAHTPILLDTGYEHHTIPW